MKNVETKAKKLLIMAENLANTSCSGILNVKTKKFGQTSKRDQLMRSIGRLFSQSVNRNKAAQSDSRVDVANDAIMQFNEAREDYHAMALCSKLIEDKYAKKESISDADQALQAMAE